MINRPLSWKKKLLAAMVVAFIMEMTLFAALAMASTVAESGNPTHTTHIDFTDGTDPDDYYVNRIALPAGTTFDRVQLAIPSGENTPRVAGIYIFKDKDDPFYTCSDNGFCVNTDQYLGQVTSNPSASIVNDDGTIKTIQYNFTATTTPTGSYVMLNFNPNTPKQNITLYTWAGGGTIKQTIENGYNDLRRQNDVLVYRFCNGLCDSSFFPAPTGTTNYTNQTTYVVINEPTYATTTATTSVNVNIKFSTPISFDPRPTTTRHYQITDALTDQIEYQYNYTLPANSAESILVNETITLTPGSKYITAYYALENGSVYSEVDEVFFNVVNNTYASSTGLDNPRASGGTLTQEITECESAFDIPCQLQRAFIFLFKPSDNVLDRYSNIWQSIRTKPPFGYVTSIIDKLKSVDDNATAAWTMPALPFVDAVFDPIRSALALLLWGIYGIFLYQRLTRLEI